jgi:hypothetical protein
LHLSRLFTKLYAVWGAPTLVEHESRIHADISP